VRQREACDHYRRAHDAGVLQVVLGLVQQEWTAVGIKWTFGGRSLRLSLPVMSPLLSALVASV